MIKKKFLGIMILLAGIMLVFSMIGCGDNGDSSSPPGDTAAALKAVGPGAWTYVLNTSSAARSARSVEKGSDYELTIRTPVAGSNVFTTATVRVTVIDIRETGGNKKLTLSPVNAADKEKYGDSFEVTLDEKGGMYQIKGLKGSQTGALVPIDDNSTTIEGAWFLWFTFEDRLLSNAIIMTKNSFSFVANEHYEDGTVIPDRSYFQRANYTLDENNKGNTILVISNWEEWVPGIGENDGYWDDYYKVNPDGGFQPTEITILEQTALTMKIDGIGNDAEEGKGTLHRITTNK
jgi:hypothetical protein